MRHGQAKGKEYYCGTAMFENGKEFSERPLMEYYLMFDFHEMNIEHRIDSCELDYI